MSDPTARDRAALRLVEMLTPAAALSIDCPECARRHEHSVGKANNLCLDEADGDFHRERLALARAELHALLLILLGDGTPEPSDLDRRTCVHCGEFAYNATPTCQVRKPIGDHEFGGASTVDESGADGLDASGLRWDGLDAAKERSKG